MRRKKKKIKIRHFWPKNPATQIHKDKKNYYDRSEDQLKWEKELEDELFDTSDELDEEFDDFT